jgi:spore maturation protein CgeB
MVEYYLENEDERNKVWELEKKIVERYTYKNQIQKMLKEVIV